MPHFSEMVKLGGEISRLMVEEHGEAFYVSRLSDAGWLACLACVLGFEWDTSGQTTVTLAALKEALSGLDLGVRIIGGKGRSGWSITREVNEVTEELGLGEEERRALLRTSILTRKVDDAALQDAHDVYFHSLIVSRGGAWCVVNQGMNIEERTARRYHWAGERGASVEEPHVDILAESEVPVVLDMTSRDSAECRSACLDIALDATPSRLRRELGEALSLLRGQASLTGAEREAVPSIPSYLEPPRSIDAASIVSAGRESSSFEDFIAQRGVGQASIRALALIASLIYGKPPSWRDPVKYSYAHGTKSGRPYYVDRRRMRRNAELLRSAVEEARLGNREKLAALRRLSGWIAED